MLRFRDVEKIHINHLTRAVDLRTSPRLPKLNAEESPEPCETVKYNPRTLLVLNWQKDQLNRLCYNTNLLFYTS